jgi:hypothetical protein
MKIVLSPTIKHDTTESRERKKTLILYSIVLLIFLLLLFGCGSYYIADTDQMTVLHNSNALLKGYL